MCSCCPILSYEFDANELQLSILIHKYEHNLCVYLLPLPLSFYELIQNIVDISSTIYAYMARMLMNRKKKIVGVLMAYMDMLDKLIFFFMFLIHSIAQRRYQRYILRSTPVEKVFVQNEYHNRLVYDTDLACLEELRMDRLTFVKLCGMLCTTGQLQETKKTDIEEIVAIFLHILAHHTKNRIVKNRLNRSGETISRHFNAVLRSVLRLHEILLKKPIPIAKNSTDERWKWFKVLKP